MNLTSWLGLGFVLLLTIAGLAAVWVTLRRIGGSTLDDDAKRKWGLLIGLSPGAGTYAWLRRDELLGHGDDGADGDDTDGADGGEPGGTNPPGV